MMAQRRREILAKAPAVRRAVVIDDAHLVVTKPVHAVFVEKELRVLNQEIAHLGLAEIEHEPAGMALVGEIQRVAIAALRRLEIEEVQALLAELAAGVVIDDVEHHRQPVQMA
jgi:hypothetical protein